MKPLSLFAECQNRRDRLVYSASFVAALVIGTAGTIDIVTVETPAWQITMIVVLGIISCLSLFYRRRWTVGVGVFTVIAGLTGPLAGGPLLIALLNVAIRRPWRVAAALAAFTVLTAPLYLALYPSGMPVLIYLLWLTIVTSGVIAWGMYIRARRELVESLRERTRQAEADRDQRLAQAREQERTRIAREMHDVLAHRISLVALTAGALEFRPDASPEVVQEAAAVVRTNAHLALDELREVISVLREESPGEIAAREPPQPTLENLGSLIEESRQAGSEVGFVSEVEEFTAVPDSTGRTAYRVVQEGLTNVRKHAAGGMAEVAVAGSPEVGLTVQIRNRRPLLTPDSGADPSGIPGSGTGLIGLSERVELAGGRLDHGRLPDGQFQLRAWLPWLT